LSLSCWIWRKLREHVAAQLWLPNLCCGKLGLMHYVQAAATRAAEQGRKRRCTR
jgi:hypothetical protein